MNTAKSHPFWTNEAMISALHVWVAEHGCVPSSATDWKRGAYGRPSARACCVRYGSWSRFIRAGGYKPRKAGGASFCDKVVNGHRVYWTKDTVAEWFLDYLVRHGEWPQSRPTRMATSVRRPSYSTVKRLFGSWVAAKKYAGWSGTCEHCGDPVWRSFQRFCSDRCTRKGPAVLIEPRCGECGTEIDNQTIGCRACLDRVRKRVERANKSAPARHMAGIEPHMASGSPRRGDSPTTTTSGEAKKPAATERRAA